MLTDKVKISQRDYPEIFLDVWSLINNSVIFYKVSSREFNLKNEEPYFQEILKAKSLRDSNQHIDERLSQVLKTENYPIYGSLSWKKRYSENGEIKVSTIYSGLFTHRNKVSMTLTNSVEDELDEFIQQIEFTGIARKGIRPDFYFEEQKISINKLVQDLKWWTNHFDQQLENQLKNFDLTKRHQSDLIIQLLGQEIKIKK
ncbi:MAG: hypothetical protein COA31_005300 [Flavobacteriales bacterium]|nr:hypothetical protein [Flavobacteriales bacterium]